MDNVWSFSKYYSLQAVIPNRNRQYAKDMLLRHCSSTLQDFLKILWDREVASDEVLQKTLIFHSVFLSLPCCLNMKIVGLMLGWNICLYCVFHKRCCCIHQGLHMCVKCICRTCEVLQAVNEDDKIYYVTSPPMTDHKPRDFVILVSQRQPCKPRWVCNFKFNCDHFGAAVLITVDFYLGLSLGDRDDILFFKKLDYTRFKIEVLMPEFAQPDLFCNVKVQLSKFRAWRICSVVQYCFFDSDSSGVVCREGI